MDLGLRIIDVAAKLGVSEWTVLAWERQRTVPSVRALPAVIRFLGYDPFPAGRTLAERILTIRRSLGMTQGQLAEHLGLDEGTVRDWKSGKPRRRHRRVVEALRALLATERLNLRLAHLMVVDADPKSSPAPSTESRPG